jgi:hypothetical protein
MPKAVVEVVRDGTPISGCGADEEGRFEATVPLEGRVDLVFRPMSGGVQHEGRIIGVMAGSEGLVLRLRELSFDRFVDVLVLASDGTPVAGLPVFAGNAHATTNDQGRARIEKLADQEVAVKCGWSVRTPSGDVFPLAVKAVPRGQEILLRFRKGVPVDGVILGTDGRPLRASITAREGREQVSFAQADDQGRFTIHIPADPTEPVRVGCAARTMDGKLLSAHADVLPGATGIRLQLREE